MVIQRTTNIRENETHMSLRESCSVTDINEWLRTTQVIECAHICVEWLTQTTSLTQELGSEEELVRPRRRWRVACESLLYNRA